MMNNITLSLAKQREPISVERVFFGLSLGISIISVVYLIKAYMYGSSWLPIDNAADMRLAVIHCVLGSIVLFVPKVISKVIGIKLPEMLCSFYYLFVLCATVLGEMFSLYYAVSFWDSILHFSSGVMIGMLGAILIVTFLKKKKCTVLITPTVIAVASVFFTLCLGLIWEIYEFSVDSWFGFNMQKFMLQDGTELVGQKALTDTMKDLLVDSFGALVAATCSYYSLKQGRGWLAEYQIQELTTIKVQPRYKRQVLTNSFPKFITNTMASNVTSQDG